jgi:hypothetical protein
MFRITLVGIFALCLAGVSSAGQIQIGGVNGLTSSYVNSGVGSSGADTEQNYNNVLFAGAQNSGTAPKAYSTYNQTTGEQGTLTDSTNNVTFSMINDGSSGGASNNFWQGTQASCGSSCFTSPEITVPIGTFGVTSVFTMINTELAMASAAGDNSKDVALFFNFGTSANQTSGLDTIEVKLLNSFASGGPNDEIQNAVLCSGSCGSPALASGSTLGGPTTISGVGVVTGNVFESSYNNTPTGYGSPGNVVLDDQGFFFNGISLSGLGAGDTNLNTYLVSVGVMELGGKIGASTGLSAITVDTVPEPSTIMLFLTGLGALGLARFRRK